MKELIQTSGTPHRPIEKSDWSMASAIGILDSNADCIISRIYTTDILPLDTIFNNFKKLVSIDPNVPILHSKEDGVNYIYIRSNDIIIMCITYYEHVNCMTLIHFLYKIQEILLNYFKTKQLNKDLIIDNFSLVYEVLDEVMDFGIPQFTDFTILRDFIKLELNESELEESKNPGVSTPRESSTPSSAQDDNYINTAILRTTTSNISWRPKGIFYSKNEFFVDVIEKLTMFIDYETNKITKHEIQGSINIKSFLSGMPILKIGLNRSNLDKFQFHQCVELDKYHQDKKTLQFVPPDGKFILGTYATPVKTAPILEVLDLEYLPKQENKIVLKLGLRTNFTQRAALTELKIYIPLALDKYDINKSVTPLFKSKIGKVYYKIDQDCVLWEIDSLGGDRESTMMAMFELKTEEVKKVELGMDPPPRRTTPRIDKLQQDMDKEIKRIKNIEITFTIPDISWSGIKVDYLKIEEPQLNYPSFPWVRYRTMSDEYVYRLR